MLGTFSAIYTRHVWRMMLRVNMAHKLLGWCLFTKLFFAAAAAGENTLTAPNDSSGVFCYNGASYIPVNTSWATRCVTYRCTGNGIMADNGTHARCDFLSNTTATRSGCRSTMVESEDKCCEGIVCPAPFEDLPTDQDVPTSLCLTGWTELRRPVLTQSLRLTRSVRQVGTPRGAVLCLKYSESRKAFYDAAQDCRQQSATLINLDYLNNVTETFAYLERNIKEVGNGFWTGLNSEGMKFYWDDLLIPKAYTYRNDCRYSTGEQLSHGWDCGQPGGNATCAMARFVDGRIVLASAPCEQKLHYACFTDSRNQRNYKSKSNRACPKDWLLNPNTKKCYKFFNERQSAFRAMSSCQDMNATLATASDRDQLLAIHSVLPDTTMSVPKEIHGSICLSSVLSNCVHPNFSLPIWFWNTTNDQWYCTTVRNLKLPWKEPNLDTNNRTLSSCYRKLPYICEKSFSHVLESLEISPQTTGDFRSLTCKAKRSLVEDGCGWRADGVYTDESGCMISLPFYQPTAYECFITDLASGSRIFSPPLIFGAQGAIAQESLRITAIMQVPSRLLNECRVPTETQSIRVLALQLLLGNMTDATARDDIMQHSSIVTCWASQSTATLIYALRITLNGRGTSKRDTASGSRSSEIINPNQSAADELSNILERNLTDYWIRKKGGALSLETGEILQVEYISVKNLHSCKKHTLSTKELGVLTVPRTTIGEWFNVSTCLSTGRPIVSMYCRPQFTTGAFWETFIQNECPDEPNLSEKRLKLLSVNLTMSPSISWHLSEVLKIVATANNESVLTTAMIVDTANLVKATLSILTDSRLPASESAKFASIIPAIVDQVMRASEEKVWQAEAIASSSSTLMKALDVASMILLEAVPIGNTTGLIYGNVALEVSRDPNLDGIGVLSSEAFSRASLVHLRSDSFVAGAKYVAQITAWLREGDKSSKRFTLYRNAKLFKGRLRVPATDVILSANIEGMQENVVMSDFIRAKFKHVKGANSQSVECGFWSTIDHDWSTKGCRKVYSDDVSTLCYCNHTTSFALLMGAKPQEQAHYQALSWITLIGLSLSIAALLLVLLTFLMFKAMRQTLSQKVLFNLSLAILLLDIVFVAGSQSARNPMACMVIAILLHYLLLCSFAWMAVEAIHQYFRFVKVIGTYIPRFIIKAAVPAWGLPALIVSIILAKDYQLYSRFDNVCWVQEPVLYYGVLLPIALVLVFNFTVFALILRSLLGQKNSNLRSNQTEMQLMTLHLRAALALLVLMGLTWTFGFLTFQETGVFGVVNQYLFCICNSIQGLLLFVFHCMREKNVVKFWKTLFRCDRTGPKRDEFLTVTSSDHERNMQTLPKKTSEDSKL